jgi:hypothetical protein
MQASLCPAQTGPEGSGKCVINVKAGVRGAGWGDGVQWVKTKNVTVVKEEQMEL